MENKTIIEPEFDICLEEDDYILDETFGTLKIDKSVFDDFIQDSIIRIQFIDEESQPVIEYQMKSEDEDYIYLDYFGN